MDQDDPLYQDLYNGFITGHSNGADVLWEILFAIVFLPVWMIIQTVKWFANGRPRA